MSMPTFHLAPDLPVSRLCFGTMTMGEQSRPPELLRLLDAAFAAGVNFFDSAEMIGRRPIRADDMDPRRAVVSRFAEYRGGD